MAEFVRRSLQVLARARRSTILASHEGPGAGIVFQRQAWLLGCSNDPSTKAHAANVTGKWYGKKVSAVADCSGDEAEYLELTQAASGVVFGVNREGSITFFRIPREQR